MADWRGDWNDRGARTVVAPRRERRAPLRRPVRGDGAPTAMKKRRVLAFACVAVIGAAAVSVAQGASFWPGNLLPGRTYPGGQT